MKTIFVDIDETICISSEENSRGRDYTNSKPINENIEKINKLFEQGNKIIYWTARGSKSGIDWKEVTKNQLDLWGVKYHELRCDKPFYDLFIDDKSFRIEEV
jgi:phosphosulfolactate synthase (CoM biosynthesis protein A)